MEGWLRENWFRIVSPIVVIAIFAIFFSLQSTSNSPVASNLAEDMTCKDYYLEKETVAWNEKASRPVEINNSFLDLVIFYSSKLDACIKVEQIATNDPKSFVAYTAVFFNLNTSQQLHEYTEFGFLKPKEGEKWVHDATASMQEHISELRGL